MRLNLHCTAMTLFPKSVEVAEIFVFLGPNLANSSQWTKCSDARVRERDVRGKKKLESKQQLKHLASKTLLWPQFLAHTHRLKYRKNPTGRRNVTLWLSEPSRDRSADKMLH